MPSAPQNPRQSLCEGGAASDVETCKKEFAPIEKLLNQTYGGRLQLRLMNEGGWKIQYNPQGSGVTMHHDDKLLEIGPSRSPEQNAFEFMVEWDDDSLENYGPSKLKKMSFEKYQEYHVRRIVDQAFDESHAAHELGVVLGVDPWEHFLKDYKGPKTIYFRTGESSVQIYYNAAWKVENPSGVASGALREKIQNSEFPARYKQEWEDLRKTCNRFKKWFGSC